MFPGISGKGNMEGGVLQWQRAPWAQLLRCSMYNLLCAWFSISGGSTPVFVWGKPSWSAEWRDQKGGRRNGLIPRGPEFWGSSHHLVLAGLNPVSPPSSAYPPLSSCGPLTLCLMLEVDPGLCRGIRWEGPLSPSPATHTFLLCAVVL